MNRSCSEEKQKRNSLATRRSTSLPRPSVYYSDLAYPDFAAVIVRDVAYRIRQSAWTSAHESNQTSAQKIPDKELKIKSFPDIASIIVGDVLGRVTPGEQRKGIKPSNDCQGIESKNDNGIINIKRKSDSGKKVTVPPVRSDIIRKSAAYESAVKSATLPANLKSLYEGQEYYDTLIQPVEQVTNTKPVRSESYFPAAYARTSIPPKYSSTSGSLTTLGALTSSVSRPKYSSVSKLESYSNQPESPNKTSPNYNSVPGLGLNKQETSLPTYDSSIEIPDYYASTSSWDSENILNPYHSNQNSFSVPKYFSTIGLSSHHRPVTSTPDSCGQPKYSSTIGIETYKPLEKYLYTSSEVHSQCQPQLNDRQPKSNLSTESKYTSVPLLDSYSNKYRPMEQINFSSSNAISPSGYSPNITSVDSLSDSKMSSSEYVQFISPSDFNNKGNSFKGPTLVPSKPPLAPKSASELPFYPQVKTLPKPSTATISNVSSKSKKKEKRPRSASASRLEDYRQRAAAVIDNAVSKVASTFASLRGRKSRKTKTSSNIPVQPNNFSHVSVKDSNTQTDDSLDDLNDSSIDDVFDRQILDQTDITPLKINLRMGDKKPLPRRADTIIKIDSPPQAGTPEAKMAPPLSIVRVSAVSQNSNLSQRRGSCPSFVAAFRSNITKQKETNSVYAPKSRQPQVNFSDREHSPKRVPQKVIIKAGIIPPVTELVKKEKSKSPIDFAELEALIDNINASIEQENMSSPNLSSLIYNKDFGQVVKNNVVKERNDSNTTIKRPVGGTEIRRSRCLDQEDVQSIQSKPINYLDQEQLAKQKEEISHPMILRREMKEEARRQFYFPKDPVAKMKSPDLHPTGFTDIDKIFTTSAKKDANLLETKDEYSHIGSAIVDSAGTGVVISFARDSISNYKSNQDMISMIVDDVTNRVSKSVPENNNSFEKSEPLIKVAPYPDIASVIVNDVIGRLTPEEQRKNRAQLNQQIKTDTAEQQPLVNSRTESSLASKNIFFPNIGAAIVESSGSGVAITFPGDKNTDTYLQNCSDVSSSIIDDVTNRVGNVKDIDELNDKQRERMIFQEINPPITEMDKVENIIPKIQDSKLGNISNFELKHPYLVYNSPEGTNKEVSEMDSNVRNVGVGNISPSIIDSYPNIGLAVAECSTPGVAVILATEGEMKDLVENAIDMASFIVHDVTNRVTSDEPEAVVFPEIKNVSQNQNELDISKNNKPTRETYSSIGPVIVDSSFPGIALLSLGIEEEMCEPIQEAPLVSSVIVSDVARRIITDLKSNMNNNVDDDDAKNVMKKDSVRADQNTTYVPPVDWQTVLRGRKSSSSLKATILSASEITELSNGIAPPTDSNVKDLAYTLPISSVQEAQFINFSSKIGLISPLTVHEPSVQEIQLSPVSTGKELEFTKIITKTADIDKSIPITSTNEVDSLLSDSISSIRKLENLSPLQSDVIILGNDEEKMFYSLSETSLPSGYETVSGEHSLDEMSEITTENNNAELQRSNIYKHLATDNLSDITSNQKKILNNELVIDLAVDIDENNLPGKEISVKETLIVCEPLSSLNPNETLNNSFSNISTENNSENDSSLEKTSAVCKPFTSSNDVQVNTSLPTSQSYTTYQSSEAALKEKIIESELQTTNGKDNAEIERILTDGEKVISLIAADINENVRPSNEMSDTDFEESRFLLGELNVNGSFISLENYHQAFPVFLEDISVPEKDGVQEFTSQDEAVLGSKTDVNHEVNKVEQNIDLKSVKNINTSKIKIQDSLKNQFGIASIDVKNDNILNDNLKSTYQLEEQLCLNHIPLLKTDIEKNILISEEPIALSSQELPLLENISIKTEQSPEINVIPSCKLSHNDEIILSTHSEDEPFITKDRYTGLQSQISNILLDDKDTFDVGSNPLDSETISSIDMMSITPVSQSVDIASISDLSNETNSIFPATKQIVSNIENESPLTKLDSLLSKCIDDEILPVNKISENIQISSSSEPCHSPSPIRVVSIALSTDKTTTVVTPEATNHLITTEDVTVNSPLSLGTLCTLSIAKASIFPTHQDKDKVYLKTSEEEIATDSKESFDAKESKRINEQDSFLDSFLSNNEKNVSVLNHEKSSSLTATSMEKHSDIAAAIVDSAHSLVAVTLCTSGTTAIDYPDIASVIVSNILDRIAVNMDEDNNNSETMPNANMLNYSEYPEIVDETVNRINAEARLAGTNRTSTLTYPDIASVIVGSVAERVVPSQKGSESTTFIMGDEASLPSTEMSYSDLASAVAREVVSRAEANKLEGTKVSTRKLPDELNSQIDNSASPVTEAIFDTTEKNISDNIAQAIVHDVIFRLTGDLGDEPDINFMNFNTDIELEDKNSDLAASIVNDVVNRIITNKSKNPPVETDADVTYPDIAAAMIEEIVDRIKPVNDKPSTSDVEELENISYPHLASAVIKTVVSKIEDKSSKESIESNKISVDDYPDVASVIAAESSLLKTSLNEEGITFVYLPIYIAAEKNRLFWIEELLESMGDPNEQDENGNTALHIASLKGYLDIVNVLLNPKYLCDVNMRNYDGNIPLHQACLKGHYEVARALITVGSNINARNIEQGLVPLHYACHHDVRLVQLLMENGAEINIREYSQCYSPLLIACIGNNYPVAELLICSGCEMTAKDIIGKSSLHHAFSSHISRPSIPLVKLLIETGCEVDAVDDDDKTPLIYACENECPEAVAMLLEHGANASFMRPDGSLPLKYAVESHNAGLVELLLQYGAGPNMSSLQETDYPPIVYAAYYNASNVIKVLLNYNCEVDRCDENGNTALHRACGNNSISIVQDLLNFGADVEKKSTSGQTALHIAARYGFIEIIKAILEYGCNVNECNEYGWSAIHWAVHKGYVDIVKVLIKAGSELHTFKEESVFGVALEKELIRFRSGDERPFVMNLEVLLMLLSAGYNLSQDKVFQPIETYLVDLDAEIVEDNEDFFELLMILSGQPQPLMQLCGHAIRKIFGQNLVKKVPLLDLPESLRQFLLFENLFTSWAEFYEVKAEGVTMIVKIV